MSRSLLTLLAAVMALLPTASAAELESMLGDWVSDAKIEQNAVTVIEPLADGATHAIVPPSTTSVRRLGDSQTLTSHGDSAPHAQVGHYEGASVLPYGPVAHQNPYVARGGCDSGCSSCQSGSAPCPTCQSRHRGCQGGGCEIVEPCSLAHLGLSECRPHHPPTLPPASTLLQYFRSRNSYSDIWVGYAEETRSRCRNTSPYIPGNATNCDACNGCGELLEPGCQCNACR